MKRFLSGKKPDANGQMPDWKDITLRNLFCRDAVKCYAELEEHPLDIKSKEGAGLLVFVARFITQQSKITFDSLASLMKTVRENETVLQPTQKDPREELRGLIGLSSVKSQIETMENFIRIQLAREAKGLKASQVSCHVVFQVIPEREKPL